MDLLQPERSPVPPLMALESGNTTEHDYETLSEQMYTALDHHSDAKTDTYDVPLTNSTSEQSPDQHDCDTSSEYMVIAPEHLGGVQTHRCDVHRTKY